MKYSGAQLTIKLLEQQGVTCIAGIPGGANLPLYDALTESTIRHLLTRHEQGAGFVAQGMARVTGQPAVCFASSGPGATNLLTAVADAHLDSIPLIAITGQVAQSLIGTDAFQEVDTFGLMLPITKHNYLVRSAAELLKVIPEAFRIATSGRPGPVAIDIPKDVQTEIIELRQWPTPREAELKPLPTPGAIEQMRSMVDAAQRPVLMLGGGVVQAGCHEELRLFAERYAVPVVSTFMGLGVIPSDHPLYLGMLGMHGAPYTNRVLEECDLLIGAGVRFDDRATGKASEFCPQADIIHIDVDASELGKIKQPAVAIQADVGTVFSHLMQSPSLDSPHGPLPGLESAQANRESAWLKRVGFLRQRFPLNLSVATADGHPTCVCPYRLLEHLAGAIDEQATVVTDVGQHQMWTAQVFPFKRPRQWISSGGLGTMGFGLPAAIGAALARPEHPVLCITGDGSIMMNIQELDTAVEHQLNIVIVVMNNQNLGLVRQQQSLFYGGRFNGTKNSRPFNFAAVAEAMGARGCDLAYATDPLAMLTLALREPGPCLIDVPIAQEAMVFPMVPPGGANKDMIEAAQ